MIATATTKTTIGEVEYEITKPLAEQGIEFSLVVAKLVVPFMAQLAPALGSGDWEAIASAARSLVVSLTPADLKYINKTLGEMTQAHLPDGRIIILRPEAFQHHFQDRFDEWITWVVFGVKTVCGSFLLGALGLGALLKKKSPNSSSATATEGATTDSSSTSPSRVERTG
jgi:hypothetical protein